MDSIIYNYLIILTIFTCYQLQKAKLNIITLLVLYFLTFKLLRKHPQLGDGTDKKT